MNQSMDSVDNVIDRLSEIEANAVHILEVTEIRKKDLANDMEEEKKSFTENLFWETGKKLNRLKEDMNLQKEKELAGLEKETKQMILRMQEKYDKEHDEMIDQIVGAIVKV